MKDDKRKLGKLLNIFKTGADVEKVLFDGEDPYMLYHLSSMRTNLLSWYEFDTAGSVLEIGAECGVLTEFLCGTSSMRCPSRKKSSISIRIRRQRQLF